jgi:ribosomal RNA-processing protein 12
MTEMASTMDLFLTSNNREIVRSVLGFVKVSVISLPLDMMLPRLKTLIPNLMVWSHEHKAHFRAKVKHILERMIRRFGYDAVERNTPDDDKKLIINIRKTKERRKRKKEAEGDEEMEEDAPKRRASKFETEFDEAIYGSESEDGSDVSDDETMGKRKAREKKKKGETFIVEDEDEPLDLLDRKALANISTTKPQKTKRPRRNTPAKTNEDGKLMLGDSGDDDAVMMDLSVEGDKGGDKLGGINAYMDAIKGKDVVQRGQRGRLKFSNKMQKGTDDDNEMEVDEEQVVQKLKTKQGAKGNGLLKRKGLGMGKTRGGRVQKSPRGKFGRR